MSSLDKTMYFNFEDNNQKDVRETLETVYDALEKRDTTRSIRSSAIFFRVIRPIFRGSMMPEI